jgi:hypothetical protein
MRGKWWVIGAVVLVGLLAQGQWVLWEQTFENTSLSNFQMSKTVGWYIVDSAWFYAEDAEVRSFPSGSRALYFGKIDKGKGTYDGAAPRDYPVGSAAKSHLRFVQGIHMIIITSRSGFECRSNTCGKWSTTHGKISM